MRKPLAVSFSSMPRPERSEEHTSELQSQSNLVCRLLLEKKKTNRRAIPALSCDSPRRDTLMNTQTPACIVVLSHYVCTFQSHSHDDPHSHSITNDSHRTY